MRTQSFSHWSRCSCGELSYTVRIGQFDGQYGRTEEEDAPLSNADTGQTRLSWGVGSSCVSGGEKGIPRNHWKTLAMGEALISLEKEIISGLDKMEIKFVVCQQVEN